MATATQDDVTGGVREVSWRVSMLHKPTHREACISWWSDPAEDEDFDALDPEFADDEPTTILFPQTLHRFALLLEIGLAGASMMVDELPEDDAVVWFRLDGDRPGQWAEADIVEATTTARGPHILRIAFRDACPFPILREAIWG